PRSSKARGNSPSYRQSNPVGQEGCCPVGGTRVGGRMAEWAWFKLEEQWRGRPRNDAWAQVWLGCREMGCAAPARAHKTLRAQGGGWGKGDALRLRAHTTWWGGRGMGVGENGMRCACAHTQLPSQGTLTPLLLNQAAEWSAQPPQGSMGIKVAPTRTIL